MAQRQGDGGRTPSQSNSRFLYHQNILAQPEAIMYPTSYGALPASLGGSAPYSVGRDGARPAARAGTTSGPTITSPPTPPPNTGGGDAQAAVDSAVADWQGTNGSGAGSKTKSPTTVPLWQVRPKSVTASGDDSISRLRRQAQADAAYADKVKLLTVPIDQAKGAYLDMSAADRKKLRDMLIANGELKPTDTDADVMNHWAQWVDRTVNYNTGRDASKYISPWEAIAKLGPLKLAGDGAGINGSGYPHPVDQTSTTTQSFTLAQIQTAAEAVLQATLKRNPNKQELQRYLDAINQAAKDNPVVTRTTGTATGPDQSNTTTTQSGGIDDNSRTAMMLNMARQDPYYAETQAATTYFDAAMQALNSPINL